MYGDLVAYDVERNQRTVTVYRDLHLRTLRALHEPDHAVLRHLHASDVLVIDKNDPVALQEAGLLRRTALHWTDDHGCIVRYIECNAYALKVSGKLGLGLFELHWRKIH